MAATTSKTPEQVIPTLPEWHFGERKKYGQKGKISYINHNNHKISMQWGSDKDKTKLKAPFGISVWTDEKDTNQAMPPGMQQMQQQYMNMMVPGMQNMQGMPGMPQQNMQMAQPAFGAKKEPDRRNLDIAVPINSPLYEFANKADALLIQKGVENCKDWFEDDRQASEDTIADRLTRTVSKQKGDYNPTIRTKVDIKNLRVFKYIVDADGKKRVEPGKYEDVTRNVELVAVVEVMGVWIVGKKFGLSLKTTQVIVFPSSEDPAFNFQLSEDVEISSKAADHDDDDGPPKKRARMSAPADDDDADTNDAASPDESAPPGQNFMPGMPGFTPGNGMPQMPGMPQMSGGFVAPGSNV